MKFYVRSRETRVYGWVIDANDPEEAKNIVEDKCGDTSEAESGDQYDDTEIIDVTPIEEMDKRT